MNIQRFRFIRLFRGGERVTGEVAVFFYQRKGHVQKCMISQAYLNCEKVRYISF